MFREIFDGFFHWRIQGFLQRFFFEKLLQKFFPGIPSSQEMMAPVTLLKCMPLFMECSAISSKIRSRFSGRLIQRFFKKIYRIFKNKNFSKDSKNFPFYHGLFEVCLMDSFVIFQGFSQVIFQLCLEEFSDGSSGTLPGIGPGKSPVIFPKTLIVFPESLYLETYSEILPKD